jgi:RND superfamily putative drug exporter
MPALIFCIAFGLSMDYEIFLLSRITEEYRRTGDTVTAIASGLQHTGRLFTSAAVIVAVVMASVATSSLAVLKMVGVGIALAVLVDATLIRTLPRPCCDAPGRKRQLVVTVAASRTRAAHLPSTSPAALIGEATVSARSSRRRRPLRPASPPERQ